MENWIVTAGSSNFYDNLLTSFVASLRETAGWQGKIGIMNYGLTPHECWTLRQNGIEIIPPKMKYAALIDDRFTTVADFFHDKNCKIAEWDLDMWFAGPVDDVFDMFEPGQLVATYDATFQGFMTSCVNPNMHHSVNKAIANVRLDLGGHVLQGGFIAGDSDAWYNYSAYQDSLIGLDVGNDSFGIDMVALNLYKYYWPKRVKKVGVEWNCLPEWVITKQGDQFFCRETNAPLRAIHVSSPNRRDPYLYKTHYPEQFNKWLNLLK